MTGAAAVAASAAVLALRQELRAGMRRIAELSLGERSVAVMAGRDSIWAIIQRGGSKGDGGLALRVAHCWGGCTSVRRPQAEGRLACAYRR